MIVGPKNPPRLPIALIIAMPAAAAVPPSSIGGIVQNTLITERWPDLADREGQHQQVQIVPERDRQEQADRRGDRARRDVQLALAGLVAVTADQHHRDQRRHERNARSAR